MIILVFHEILDVMNVNLGRLSKCVTFLMDGGGIQLESVSARDGFGVDVGSRFHKTSGGCLLPFRRETREQYCTLYLPFATCMLSPVVPLKASC